MLDLSGHKAHVGPSVVNPEHRHESETKRADREAPRGNRWSVMATARRQTNGEAQCDKNQETTDLRESGDILYRPRCADSDVAERPRDNYRRRRDVMSVPAERRDMR